MVGDGARVDEDDDVDWTVRSTLARLAQNESDETFSGRSSEVNLIINEILSEARDAVNPGNVVELQTHQTSLERPPQGQNLLLVPGQAGSL